MPAWTPERGNSTPTFKAAPWARKMLNGAVPATIALAATPALKARRLTRARVLTDLFCEFLLMLFLPRAALGRGLSKISHRLIRPPPGLRSPPGWADAGRQ